MSFAIYMIGFVIFIAGVAWALVTAGVPHLYVALGATILLGIGIFRGVGKTRAQD